MKPLFSNLSRRFCRGASVLALTFGLLLPGARAYNTTPNQWPGGSIPLVIALGPANRTLADGNTSWDEVAESAAAAWNSHLGVVQFTPAANDGATPRQGDGQNTVAFSDTIYGDSFGDETIAVTLIHHSESTNEDTNDIEEADVLVNRKDTFDSYNGPLRNPGTGQNIDLHRVLLHEFGHVLGLDHPDKAHQTVEAVMNSVISNTDHLTPDDILGVTMIYGDPAIRSVKLTAWGVAVDDSRGKIFVSTRKGNGKGSLKVIDPYLARITASVHTGRNPYEMVLSGGGEHLYLGVDGLGVIDQINPDTLATTQQIALGAQSGVTAADLAVLPGAPESILVSQVGNTRGARLHDASPIAADFAVYDHGVLRPEEEFDGGESPGTPIILAESGRTFYGFLGSFGGTTNGFVTRLTIEAGGVSPKIQPDVLQTGDLNGGVEYSQGLLYGTDGSVADLAHGTHQRGFGNVGDAETVEINTALGQAYFAVRGNNDFQSLRVEDIAARSTLGTIPLPRNAQVLRIRHWGGNGLVLGLNSNRTLLLRSNLIAPGPVTGVPETVSLRPPKVAALNEGKPGKSKVVVTRMGSDFSAPLRVRYDVSGTALNGVDYRTLKGTVTIPAGAASAKIKIAPTGSQFSDGPRTLRVQLAVDPAYRLARPSLAALTLTDD